MHDFDEPDRIYLRLRPELYDDEAPFPVDGVHAEPVCHDADASVFRQIEHRIGRRAVTIDDFVERRLQLLVGPRAGDLAIHHQPLVHVGDVAFVDLEVDAEVHRRAHVVFDVLALQLAHGFLEQLHVHLEADGIDVPALLTAEQIARAANLEVERGHAEAAAEIAELLDGGEPLARDRRQRFLRRNQQIRVRRPIRPANTAAQLIELRQAVPIRAVDDDGVGVRNVEAVLDDCRRQQDVVLPLDEAEHRALELVLGHLAVADDDLRVGHQALQQVTDREDRFHPVVDEIDLSAARHFVSHRARDDGRVELDDIRLDRESILRRRLDDRHVANADERHVQRPRNRRRRHRQHVDLLAHLLDALLVRDAEALLLVDDQQSEVFENDVFRKQAMRADDDVNLARGDAFEDGLDLLLRAEAADHVDHHGEALESIAQRLQMLEREHRRRREHGDLLAVHHRLERGAHGDFRLAVADVAAQQAIHRRRRFHIVLDLGDRRGLIDRQLVRERRLELFLPVRVGRERVAGNGFALRIELEQLFGHVAHRLLDARLGLFPRGAAEPIECRPCAARVLLNEIKAFDGR